MVWFKPCKKITIDVFFEFQLITYTRPLDSWWHWNILVRNYSLLHSRRRSRTDELNHYHPITSCILHIVVGDCFVTYSYVSCFLYEINYGDPLLEVLFIGTPGSRCNCLRKKSIEEKKEKKMNITKLETIKLLIVVLELVKVSSVLVISCFVNWDVFHILMVHNGPPEVISYFECRVTLTYF